MIFFSTILKKNSFISVLRCSTTVFWLCWLNTSAIAKQQPLFESAENIRMAAKIFLEEITNAADNLSIVIKIGDLDPRLRLRHCENKLQALLPQSAKQRGKITVGVSCAQPVLWKVFVSATVFEYADVVVAKNVLEKKSIITEQDIEIKRVNISTLRKQPILDKTQVINTSAKRYLRAGTIISDDSICMVCRGDQVEITAKNQFFNINLKGIALADAAMGSNTTIRNSQSNRSFTARVIGRNQLEVPLIATQ